MLENKTMGWVRRVLSCSVAVLLLSVLWHWASHVDIEGMNSSSMNRPLR